MTLELLCILLAIVYGIVCGGVYTWVSPHRRGTWRMMLRATGIFTIVGIVIAVILYEIFK